MRIPFTKAIIIRHVKGDRWTISCSKHAEPYKITIIRVGRIVFYSNYDVVWKALDEIEKPNENTTK